MNQNLTRRQRRNLLNSIFVTFDSCTGQPRSYTVETLRQICERDRVNRATRPSIRQR